MGAEKIKNQKGLWLFLAPVSGLILSKKLNEELTVNKVTFVSKNKLPRIRKRLGFPITIGELKNKRKVLFNRFFDETKTYAVCLLGGKGKDKEKKFPQLARDEINILSLSQLGYGRRRINARLSLANEKRPGSLSYFSMHTGNKSWSMRSELSGHFMELRLDENWKKFQQSSFFYKLLKVLKGKHNISRGWFCDIKNAAVIAGQSQSSSNLSQAFLWNMIAIETLLTHQGDTYLSELPKRVEAFIGWTVDWSVSDYEKKIKDVYDKRCKFVHTGRNEGLNIEDLLFTDILLLNIFYNILKHLDLFYDKEALISFSEKIKAEHLLGIKSKVRPKTLEFFDMKYSDRDYKKM